MGATERLAAFSTDTLSMIDGLETQSDLNALMTILR